MKVRERNRKRARKSKRERQRECVRERENRQFFLGKVNNIKIYMFYILAT